MFEEPTTLIALLFIMVGCLHLWQTAKIMSITKDVERLNKTINELYRNVQAEEAQPENQPAKTRTMWGDE